MQLRDVILTNFNVSGPPSANYKQVELLELNDPVVERFRTEILVPTINNYLSKVYDTTLDNYPDHLIRSWIAGYHDGFGLVNHNHPAAQVSAVFYVMAEEIVNSGVVTFIDPRANSNRGYDEHFQKFFNDENLAPKTGDFLVFPSYVYHHVWPYYSGLRISVPVDVYLYKEFAPKVVKE